MDKEYNAPVLGVVENARELSAIYRKVSCRILPICMIAYVISFLDRSNIGMAKLQFIKDLNFNESIYGLGSGLFFIGYTVFEIPSNLMIEKRGARVTLAVIMMLWGMISSCMALVNSPNEFYVLRFVLGLAEAGLFPGIILYLSYWFPEARRGRMTALFALGGPIAGVLGGPLGGWLMASFSGFYGMRGWQSLFVFEGIPAIVLGVFVVFYLNDRPGAVKWLSFSENQTLIRTLQSEHKSNQGQHSNFLQALREPKIYVSLLAWIGVIAGVTVVTLWTPTFLSQRGGGSIKSVGMLSAIPPICAAFSMYFVAQNSDRLNERRWHFTLALSAAALSLLALIFTSTSLWLTIVLLSIASSGLWSATPIFWAVPTTYLRDTAAAGGIALISSSGGLGGFFAPIIIGWTKAHTGNFTIGIAVIAIYIFIAAISFLLGTRSLVIPKLGQYSK